MGRMKRSTERIITSPVGSLARPHPLLDVMREKEHGRDYDHEQFTRMITEAVDDRVHRQADAGLDVLTDGEQGKTGFFTYVGERLGGVEPRSGESFMPATWAKEVEAFPDYYADYFAKYKGDVSPLKLTACVGPVTYIGQDAVATDIANLRAALEGVDHVDAFLPSASPSGFGTNEYYDNDTDYTVAVAEALREEYLAIVEAGFLLQVDDPWLVELIAEDPDNPRAAQEHVEIINHALRDIPADKIRFHTCYGLNHGPRLTDLPMSTIAPLMLTVNAGAYSFEVANPRHQHEWRVWEDIPVPEGKVLIPGFVGHATNYVEHPRWIADQIEIYAKVVGKENIIAGADCGFSSRATYKPEVNEMVAWEKMRTLAEGAALASKELWG
jgi:5-methyltetrahydropteroyltriglutamate--homocysteine methyltransferase